MSNPSSDPLASVITQVQPGQGAPTMARGGPARPTKVAKPGTAKAAAEQQKKKKKKKKQPQQQQPVASANAASTSAEADATTTTAAATTSAEASPSQVAAGDGGDLGGGESASPQHSTEPSSTLVGTTISEAPAGGTAPDASAVAAATSDESAAPAATKDVAGDTPAASSDVRASAEKTSTVSPQPSTTAAPAAGKAAATTTTPVGNGPPATKPATTPARSAAVTQEKSKKKSSSRSPLKKLIAILTCTTASYAIVEDEQGTSPRSRKNAAEEIEMQSSAVAPGPSQARKPSSKDGASAASAAPAATNSTTRADNGKLAPPIKTRSGRSGSRSSGSARNSLDRRSETGVVAPAPGTPTAGGGTQLPKEETGDVMSGAVVPPGSSFVVPGSSKRGGSSASATPTPSKKGGRGGDSDLESESDGSSEASDDDQDDDVVDEYADDEISEEQRLIAQGGMGIPTDEFGNPRPLLAPLASQDAGRKCLVLDLDETLVHSSFKMISNADFIVPVEIEGTLHNVYVIKRPGVDEFMRQMGEIYEVVVFTASLSKYADPVLDILDIHRVVRHRLFRESCYNHRGNYVKDLSQLGRPIEDSIIIDNSPASYVFHNGNAVPISSWFNDPHDTELVDLCPFLEDLSEVHDVRAVLDGGL